MMQDKKLMERVFSKFNVDAYTFILQPEIVLGESERATIYACRQLNSVFKNVQVALKIFNQSRSQLELTIRASALFPKMNDCPYIVNHYAIGVINNFLALCLDYIEGDNIEHIVRNRILDASELKEVLKGYMEAMQFLNRKNILHNNITLSSLYVTPKHKPLLGCIKISEEKAKRSNFYEFGWLLIQLFSEFDDTQISELKKSHVRKQFSHPKFPPQFLYVINELILYQQIADEDILLKHQKNIHQHFIDLCKIHLVQMIFPYLIYQCLISQKGDKDEQFLVFLQSFSSEKANFSNTPVRMSPLKRKVIMNQKNYFLNTTLVDQRELIRAENMFQSGSIPQASEEFYRIIAKTKWQDATPIYNLAYLHFQVKNYSKAIQLFKKSIKLNPQHSSAYNLIGCTYDEKNQCYSSLKYYKKSIQLDANSGNFLNNIGIYYFKQKQYEISIKFIRRALQLEPNDDRIHGNLGMNYLKLKDYHNAKIHLKKQISINPKTGSGYYSLAILYRMIDKIQKSVYFFQKHAEVNPCQAYTINQIIEIIEQSVNSQDNTKLTTQIT